MTPDSLTAVHHAGFWLGFWIGALLFLAAGIVLGIVAMLLLAAHGDRDTMDATHERRAVRRFVEARKLT